MENNFKIEVTEAFLVTRETITTVPVFTMKEAGNYGPTDNTYYLTDTGWKQARSWSWGGERIAYTQEEAETTKKEMMAAHLEWLKNEKIKTEKQIVSIEEELSK